MSNTHPCVSPVPALPAESFPCSGAAPSFEHVFQEHAAFVWRALRRLGVHASDVEDVCQEVFLTVHRRLDAFEARASLRTWIYGITVRTAANERRKQRRRPEDLVEAPDAIVPEQQIEQLQQRQAVAMLDAVLDRIDDEKRAVFVLFEIEEVPMRDVAEAVGCPLQTAYARLYAGRRQYDAALRRLQLEKRIP